MADVGQMYVQVVPSAKGIKSKLEQTMDKDASAAGVSAGGKIGAGIKKVIGAVAIGAAITKSIQEGARYEQAVGGIETLFKESSDRMIQYANNAWKTAGISANDYMEQSTSFAASLLQSLGGDSKKAAEAANQAVIDMADNSNKMGTSLESIQFAYQGFAKQNYTMLDNLKLGYGGTKTEMQRLLSDAQKLTGVKYDISNLSDVYEAIHVIQGELGITGTTAKEAATTISGSFNSMKAAASNFAAQLVAGQDVSGAMSGLVESATTFLFGNLIPAIVQIGVNIPQALMTGMQTAGPALQAGMQQMMTKIFGENASIDGVMANLGEKIVNGYINIQTLLVQATQGIFSAIQTYLPTVIQNIGSIIQTQFPVLIESLGSLAESLLSTVLEFFSGDQLGTLGADLVNSISEGLANALPKIGDLVGNIGAMLIDALPGLLNNAIKLGKSIIDGILKVLPQLAASAGTIIGKLVAALIKNGPKLIAGAAKLVATLVSGLIKAIPSLISAAGKLIAGFVKGLMSGVVSKMKGVIDKIKSFFNFKVSLPKIKLPHFSISPAGWKLGDLLKGSIPHLGISWYAKGGIVDKPTILGAGEKGREGIIPLEGRAMKPFAEAIAKNINGNGGNTYNFGNFTIEAHDLADISTVEEFVRRIMVNDMTRAKAFG